MLIMLKCYNEFSFALPALACLSSGLRQSIERQKLLLISPAVGREFAFCFLIAI